MTQLKLDFTKDSEEFDLYDDDTALDVGDYVVATNFEGLSEKAIAFLNDKPYHRIQNITDKRGSMYTEGEAYAEVGYNIPLKLYRFVRIPRPDDVPSKNILFLQFNLNIDTHNEPDTDNFFKGQTDIKSLIPMLVNDRTNDLGVDFYDYNDIYKIEQSYYVKGTDLKDYKFVFFGFMSKQSQIAKIIINYLDRNKVPYLKYETFDVEDNKAYGMDVVESLGYPYIPTILTYQLTNKIMRQVEKWGYPVIVKDVNMDRGTGVFKVDNQVDLLNQFSFNNKMMMMIQKFIPNTGDFRVIVIKNKVELVVKRQQTKAQIDSGEFRSNVALGGKAVKAELPQHILKMCEDISKHLSCDIIGFDILQDESNKSNYYVMETNISPHFSTFSVVTGINIPNILINYIFDNMKN